MNTSSAVIEVKNLKRRFGKLDAVNGLNLACGPARCFGFFGRNGAGKTTTIKCLLNLLRPTSGSVSVFGLDPRRDEVAVKSRLAYVPDCCGVLSVDDRARDALLPGLLPADWNIEVEADLLRRFELDPAKRPAICPRARKHNWP